jgi:acyl carrier protein
MIEDEIKSLVAKVVKIPEEKLKMEADLFADLGIDSLLGIEIFAALDKKYKIDIPETRLRDVKTLADLIKVVSEFKK